MIGAAREIEDVFVHVTCAAQNLSHSARSFELDPIVIAGESLLQAPVMNPPAPNQEIKVVDSRRPVFSFFRFWFHFACLRSFICGDGGLLRLRE
jgi:hypothetical protein